MGTTFCVYLPASDRPLLDAASADPKALDVPAGGGRVLLMDDEATVRDVGGRMLQALGLEPAFAVDGEQALDLYAQAQAAGRPFEVVIMDLTVPGAMGGREATARLLEQDPHARIVVSSGYSNDPVMSDPARYGFTGILRKPYTKDDLNVVVVEQLAARRATSASGVKGEVEA